MVLLFVLLFVLLLLLLLLAVNWRIFWLQQGSFLGLVVNSAKTPQSQPSINKVLSRVVCLLLLLSQFLSILPRSVFEDHLNFCWTFFIIYVFVLFSVVWFPCNVKLWMCLFSSEWCCFYFNQLRPCDCNDNRYVIIVISVMTN